MRCAIVAECVAKELRDDANARGKFMNAAEVPMKCGFLQRRVARFFVFKGARRTPPARVFTGVMTLTLVDSHRENNFAPEAFAGLLTPSSRRKTRESVATDSRWRLVSSPRRMALSVAVPDFRAVRTARRTHRDVFGNV